MPARKLTVDELAARVRAAARAKPLGPLRAVRYYALKGDYLECGHIVPSSPENSARRRCPKCVK